MFTGMIDHCGTLVELERTGRGMRIHVTTRFERLTPGESIAVDGACLTVTSVTERGFRADLSPETLELTIARGYAPGLRVNLERPLAVGDRLGGHWVTGHVEERGRVSGHEWQGEFLKLGIDGVSPERRRFLFPKGSVTVNGVSLTVNAVTEGGFEVMLIPHTLDRTNLGTLALGSEVNLELDWMVKVLLTDRDERLRALQARGENA